jgi:hypothetical protein
MSFEQLFGGIGCGRLKFQESKFPLRVLDVWSVEVVWPFLGYLLRTPRFTKSFLRETMPKPEIPPSKNAIFLLGWMRRTISRSLKKSKV